MLKLTYGIPSLNYQDSMGIPGMGGDLFNGLLSLASYAKKNKDSSIKFISAPLSKFDIVSLFYAEKMIPVLPDNMQTIEKLHICDVHAHALNTNSPFLKFCKNRTTNTVWHYFLLRGITQEDILKNFSITGTPNMSVEEQDIIIFPSAGGDGSKLLPPEFYLNFIEDHYPGNRKVYWNKETNSLHKNNCPPKGDILTSSIKDILATLFHRNPIVMGHRSGIFDIMFHVLPPNRTSDVTCFYETSQPNKQLHADWCLKGDNVPEQFKEFSESRKYYREIGVDR